jgi:hypothetical protein
MPHIYFLLIIVYGPKYHVTSKDPFIDVLSFRQFVYLLIRILDFSFGVALGVSNLQSYRGSMRLVSLQSSLYIGQSFSSFLPFFSIPVYIILEKGNNFVIIFG